MIRVLLYSLLIHTCWARNSMELKPARSEVNQGEIFSGALILREGSIPAAGLAGRTLGKSLYVVSVGPYVRNGESLEASVRLIFTEVPKASQVSDLVSGEDLLINWKDLKVNPTEAKSYLLGNFEIPLRRKLLPWLLSVLGITALIILGLFFFRRWKKKSESKRLRRQLLDQLLSVSSYEHVVDVWQLKHTYLKFFPGLEIPFKELELTLFQHLFKPSRTASEIEKILSAYAEFKDNVMKEENGV